MSTPAMGTGPAFWIAYFRRVRARRRRWWWLRWWHYQRCAMCHERVAIATFGDHVLTQHPADRAPASAGGGRR